MTLTKNQMIPLSITALSNDGNGIGRYEGFAVFVPFTAVGDTLTVRIAKVCKSYAFGIVAEILSPSPDRIAADCSIFGKCGGCCFRHLAYDAELRAKEGFVSDAMLRLGGIDLPVKPILPSPDEQRYRNKVQYPVYQDESGTVKAGFFAGRSHRVIPCADCKLQPEVLNQISTTVCALLTQFKISAYDETLHKGIVRHIYLRHAITTGEIMLCLVINSKTLPFAKDFCDALIEKQPQISTVVLNINREKTNVITGTVCKTIYGSGNIHDEMAGVPVTLNPLSFYQVNTKGANRLYAAAAALADLKPEETLLDLYCGAGTIGLSMAHQCKKLIGVEIIPEAIESAKQNAKNMGIEHAEFLCSDAGKAAEKLAAQGLAPDVVVLDPPRKGCDEITLNAVLKMHPQRIIMVSCNPSTAARDTKYLSDNGYKPQVIQPVDMFPRTKHVETCVLLSHKNPQTSPPSL